MERHKSIFKESNTPIFDKWKELQMQVEKQVFDKIIELYGDDKNISEHLKNAENKLFSQFINFSLELKKEKI